RSKVERSRLSEYHRTVDPGYRKLAEAVATHAKRAPKPRTSIVPTLAERAGGRKTRLLVRGDFLRPADEVLSGTPRVLHPLSAAGERATRLDFARWLVAPANPLTARVTVNRFWRHLFGRGLTESIDDFGTRGEKPSHRELLDWLAMEFPRVGWSQK